MMQRLPNWLASLLLLALTIQVGWLGGQWTWRLVWQDLPAPSVEASAQGGSDSMARIRLQELELFGHSQREADELSEVVRETAPQTGLRLSLHGVFLATPQERSSAILSEDGDEARLYRVGDDLPGNAELVAVESSRILLRRNGEVEALSFEDEEMEMGMIARRSEAPADQEAFLDMASEQLEDDPEQALSSVGFRPRDDGPGYVYDGTNEQLSDMNLRSGDVILSINGHELGDVASDRERMRDWADSDSLQLVIERAGTRFSFSVPVP